MKDALVRTVAVIVLATAWDLAGCASQRATIEQQKEKLQSLAASTRLLTDDVLAGEVSKTYARTALDALFLQVEQQRAVLAAKPATLTDPVGAALSQQAEQLARAIAAMQADVQQQDNERLRRRLAALPLAQY